MCNLVLCPNIYILWKSFSSTPLALIQPSYKVKTNRTQTWKFICFISLKQRESKWSSIMSRYYLKIFIQASSKLISSSTLPQSTFLQLIIFHKVSQTQIGLRFRNSLHLPPSHSPGPEVAGLHWTNSGPPSTLSECNSNCFVTRKYQARCHRVCRRGCRRGFSGWRNANANQCQCTISLQTVVIIQP